MVADIFIDLFVVVFCIVILSMQLLVNEMDQNNVQCWNKLPDKEDEKVTLTKV